MMGPQPFIPTNPVAGTPEFGEYNTFNSGKVAMATMFFWYVILLPDAGKAVPRHSRRGGGEATQERRADRVVQEVEEGRPVSGAKGVDVGQGRLDGQELVAAPLGPLRAEGTVVPVAAAGRAVRQDEAGGKVVGKGKGVVGRDHGRRRPALPAQGEEGKLARPGDEVIHEPAKGGASAGPPHPRGNEPTAEHDGETGKTPP